MGTESEQKWQDWVISEKKELEKALACQNFLWFRYYLNLQYRERTQYGFYIWNGLSGPILNNLMLLHCWNNCWLASWGKRMWADSTLGFLEKYPRSLCGWNSMATVPLQCPEAKPECLWRNLKEKTPSKKITLTSFRSQLLNYLNTHEISRFL